MDAEKSCPNRAPHPAHEWKVLESLAARACPGVSEPVREAAATRAAVTLIPGYLIWWRGNRQWGINRDCYGRVLDFGRLRFYPKGDA